MIAPSAARTLLVAAAALGCSPDAWYTVSPRDAARDAPDVLLEAGTTDDAGTAADAASPACRRPDADAPNGCPTGQMRCDDACAQGPTSLYRAEDDACDAVGTLHATHNNADFVEGRFGRAFSFGGNSARQYVELPAALGDFGTGDFTVTLWFATTVHGDLISKRSACWGGPAFTGLDLRMSRAGDLFLEVWTTTTQVALRSRAGLNDGAWHHVAIVRRGNALTLNIDGAAAPSSALSGAMTDPSGTPTYLGVGRCVWDSPGWNGMQDGTTWFDGAIDDVAYFPRALTERELVAAAQGRCVL